MSSLPGTIRSGSFDFIVDNWSKKPDNAALFIDIAKKAGTSLFDHLMDC